jgi:hypothetical protein
LLKNEGTIIEEDDGISIYFDKFYDFLMKNNHEEVVDLFVFLLNEFVNNKQDMSKCDD